MGSVSTEVRCWWDLQACEVHAALCLRPVAFCLKTPAFFFFSLVIMTDVGEACASVFIKLCFSDFAS